MTVGLWLLLLFPFFLNNKEMGLFRYTNFFKKKYFFLSQNMFSSTSYCFWIFSVFSDNLNALNKGDMREKGQLP